MHDVDDALVVLDLARRVAPPRVDLVAARVEQQTAGLELRIDGRPREEDRAAVGVALAGGVHRDASTVTTEAAAAPIAASS